MQIKNTQLIRRIVSGLILIAAVLFLVANLPQMSYTQTSGVPRRAPLNRAFVDYMNARAGGLVATRTVDGHSLGLVPSMHNIPSAGLRPLMTVGAEASLPASYDLRTLNKLTAVRDQGDCGSCWSFATYGSLESFYKPGEAFDFSENDMISNHGWNWGPCEGGNIDMAAAYLARWSGPLNESDNPYPYLLADSVGAGTTVLKHVQNIAYLPVRASADDNLDIKQAVMTSGAVYVSFYYGTSYFNSLTNSYYCGTNIQHNHAVCIVGWDDGYSKGKFKQQPPGNGAFIVRNSWGASWGKSGYFYVSYYDRNFGRAYTSADSYNAAAVTAEPVTNHTTIYQYDPLGWVENEGWGTTTGWGANIFVAANTTPLTAVSFYASTAGTSYEIFVYTGVTAGSPRLGTLRADLSGSTTYAGYCTVDLPSSVALTAGQRFSVVIQFTTPGYNYPVPVEDVYPGWTDGATASPGQSFLSSNGTTWQDTTVVDSTENVCIKAFAGESVPPATIAVTAPATGAIWGTGTSQTITWDTTGLTSPNVSILLMEGSYLIGTVSSSTANDGSFSWPIPASLAGGADYSIRIKATDELSQGDSGLFTVLVPYVTVSSPAGGDVWYKGETKLVTWTENGAASPYVKIQLYHGPTLTKTLASAAPNSGSYSWTIAKGLAARTDYYLKLTTTDGKATGESGTFTVKAPTITVTSPAKGSLWTRGSTLPIAWTSAGPQSAFVSIVLRRNGIVKMTIVSSTDNDGSFDWPIPTSLAAGSGYDIRIKTADGVVKAFSGKFSLN